MFYDGFDGGLCFSVQENEYGDQCRPKTEDLIKTGTQNQSKTVMNNAKPFRTYKNVCHV